MMTPSPTELTQGGSASISLMHSQADLRTLAETAVFLQVIDEWIPTADAIHFRLGTVTLSLPEDRAAYFVQGLLRNYEDLLRQHGVIRYPSLTNR